MIHNYLKDTGLNRNIFDQIIHIYCWLPAAGPVIEKIEIEIQVGEKAAEKIIKVINMSQEEETIEAKNVLMKLKNILVPGLKNATRSSSSSSSSRALKSRSSSSSSSSKSSSRVSSISSQSSSSSSRRRSKLVDTNASLNKKSKRVSSSSSSRSSSRSSSQSSSSSSSSRMSKVRPVFLSKYFNLGKKEQRHHMKYIALCSN